METRPEQGVAVAAKGPFKTNNRFSGPCGSQDGGISSNAILATKPRPPRIRQVPGSGWRATDPVSTLTRNTLLSFMSTPFLVYILAKMSVSHSKGKNNFRH
jgi:hypothetical protein